MTERAQIVIIGGGAIGLSIAYHLGHLGVQDVVLAGTPSAHQRYQLACSWYRRTLKGQHESNPVG